MEKLSYFFYKILKHFDLILNYLFKKSFLIFFNDFFNKDFYVTKTINNLKINFFIPNQVIKWRVKTLYTKEPETLEWIDSFKNYNKKPIIFWDIGSNIGLYSIYAATQIENIEVISFEPSTSNLRILSRNISINNLENKIKIFQIPLGLKKSNFLEFNERIFSEGESNNSIDKNINFEGKKMKSGNKYQIFSTNIDQIIDNEILEVPDYIKIDVDGVEHLILKGGMKFFKNPKILEIQIEVNENYSDQHNNVLKIMDECSFNFKEKKRNDLSGYYKAKKLSKIYNYYFTR